MSSKLVPAARCEDNGLLVNARGLLPADPHRYHLPGSPVLIGCNQLRCTACGSVVRQQGGVWVSKAGSVPAELFAADWATWAAITENAVTRLYACPCGWWNQTTDVTTLDEDDPLRPTPPWGCAGHPPITLPCDLDGVALEAGTDVAALVRRVVVDREPAPGAIESEKTRPFAWLAKLYQLLAASSNGQALGGAVARAVVDLWPGDVAVRTQVIEFFRIVPGAPGADALAERYLTSPSDLVAVRRPPKCQPATLEELFAWFLRARVKHLQAQGTSIDERLAEVVVRGLLEARRRLKTNERGAKQVAGEWLETLQAAVACSDAPFAARAEELVKGDPKLALPLLQALQQAGSVRLVDVGVRVAALPGVDRAALAAFGGQVGGQLKAALRGAT